MTINMYDYFTHIINNNNRRIINIFCKKNLLNFEIFWKISFGASVHGPCIVPNKLVYSGIFSLEHERVYTRLLGRTEYVFTFMSGHLCPGQICPGPFMS